MPATELYFSGDRFIFRGAFETRHLPKQAGFRWDKDAKQWWTQEQDKAAKLAAYAATPELKRQLANLEDRKRITLAASRATDAAIEVPFPEGVTARGYQLAGIAYALSRKNTLLGDDMGLGKSLQALALANVDLSINKILVICPASLKLNWYREFKKFSTRNFQIAIVESGRTFPYGFGVTIINFDILHSFEFSLRREPWDLLIVDEAHMIRNSSARRTRQVVGGREIKDKKSGDVKHVAIDPIPCKRAVFCTGTPISNRPKELWPLVNFLDPQTWNNEFQFLRRYCGATRGRFGFESNGASNLPELQEKLRSTIMIRRLKADVLTELPPKIRQVIELPVTAEARAVVDAELAAFHAQEDLIVELRAAVEIAKASDDREEYNQAVIKLRAGMQAAFTKIAKLRHDTAVATVPYVIEHLRDIVDARQKCIVFGHHIDAIDAIAKEFAGKCVKLDGRDTMQERQAAVDRFQRDPDTLLFIGGIMAAGVGLTLTAASHVVFAELDWTPANVTQAEDRAHRIGQHNSVLVQHLVLEGSLAATMARKIIAKQDVIDRALDRQGGADDPQLPLIPTDDAGSGSTRDRIHREAESIKPAQIIATHRAIQLLAAACDGARGIDGHGFNKLDARIGRSLAQCPALTPRQAALGRKIAGKYRRQIGDDLADAMWS
jgi:SWI/SNF-related matrix-associated actin-dependent regulator 1 of chromatin subfamily A